ncbi:MAG: GYF domain-containing protein [Planctomycetia bacterium]|nr:GYF domain-containing protein [Planctomycetia bacterium]
MGSRAAKLKMGIRFQCPACGAKLNVKTELAGKRGACPKCQAKIQIPASDEAEAVAAAVSPSGAATNGAASPVAPAPAPVASNGMSAAAAAVESKWFVRPPSGGQYGPAAESVLRQWIAEGRITPDTLIWREGDPEWQPAAAAFSELGNRPVPVTAPVKAERPALSSKTMVSFPTAPIPQDVDELDAASAATAMLLAKRKRARSTGLIIMGVLVLCVLLLLPILIYVLTNPGGTPPAGESTGQWPSVRSVLSEAQLS